MANLSDNPTGYELEDFVAAHLAARGRFVETGVTERDPVDILELDVVWTDYDHDEAPRYPVEVKSGNWGLSDLFKFYGWSRYLGIGPGWFFVRLLPERVAADSLRRLCERLEIRLCHVPNVEAAPAILEGRGLPEPPAGWLPSLWRFSYWIQRRLLASLGRAIKTGVCPETARRARDYQKLINDAVFFETDPRARVSSLMDAHWGHPQLARSAAAEVAGLGVHFEDPPFSDQFKQALYDGRHFPVQACLYLEHRARLGILKAAVDYLIARQAGRLPSTIVRLFGRDFVLEDWNLYQAFQRVVAQLESDPNFQRYPVFWQSFLWSWGGFILADREDAELDQLSVETGVPREQVSSALSLWDELFPIDGGWFAQPSGDTRRQLKLMPAAVRGIGAYRRLLIAGVDNYQELRLGDYTPCRLATDHNTVVRLLDGGEDELVR